MGGRSEVVRKSLPMLQLNKRCAEGEWSTSKKKFAREEERRQNISKYKLDRERHVPTCGPHYFIGIEAIKMKAQISSESDAYPLFGSV